MKPILVAVVGGSASGKTTLACDLVQALHPDSTRISQDTFYLGANHLAPARRDRLNFDHPRRIDWPLLSRVLDDVLARRTTRLPRYNFEQHAREKGWDPLAPAPFVVLEGLWLLRRREIRARCALRIFVTCPAAERLRRRIRRDTTERGRSRAQVLQQWTQHTEPGFRRFVATQRRHAHIVVRSPVTPQQIDRLAHTVRALAETTP